MAGSSWATCSPSLKAEPRLADIRGRAERLLEQAERGLQDEADQRRDRERQRHFVERRNEAFFHETRFTGLDLPADVQATRAAARAALAVFADPGPDDAWTLRAAAARRSRRQEQAEIGEGCYELLLVLAEAVAQALPGEDPVLQADRGLRILDQAARLRSQPTPACHRARAACLARKGDEAGAARERAAAERLRPTTVLDHFLAGREAYRRQDWKTALAEFETVLRMQPDHFWAQCLAAIASLQTNQPGMAKLGLNVCIEQRARVRLALPAPRLRLGAGGGPGPDGGQDAQDRGRLDRGGRGGPVRGRRGRLPQGARAARAKSRTTSSATSCWSIAP